MPDTMRRRYNMVNFLKDIHKRHPIARPLGRGKGCLLWIQHLIDIIAIIYAISSYFGPRYITYFADMGNSVAHKFDVTGLNLRS